MILVVLICSYLLFNVLHYSVTLIMRLWDQNNLVAILVEFNTDSLLLFPSHLRRSIRLMINQSVGSCRVELIPEVRVIFCYMLPKVILI